MFRGFSGCGPSGFSAFRLRPAAGRAARRSAGFPLSLSLESSSKFGDASVRLKLLPTLKLQRDDGLLGSSERDERIRLARWCALGATPPIALGRALVEQHSRREALEASVGLDPASGSPRVRRRPGRDDRPCGSMGRDGWLEKSLERANPRSTGSVQAFGTTFSYRDYVRHGTASGGRRDLACRFGKPLDPRREPVEGAPRSAAPGALSTGC